MSKENAWVESAETVRACAGARGIRQRHRGDGASGRHVAAHGRGSDAGWLRAAAAGRHEDGASAPAAAPLFLLRVLRVVCILSPRRGCSAQGQRDVRAASPRNPSVPCSWDRRNVGRGARAFALGSDASTLRRSLGEHIRHGDAPRPKVASARRGVMSYSRAVGQAPTVGHRVSTDAQRAAGRMQEGARRPDTAPRLLSADAPALRLLTTTPPSGPARSPRRPRCPSPRGGASRRWRSPAQGRRRGTPRPRRTRDRGGRASR